MAKKGNRLAGVAEGEKSVGASVGRVAGAKRRPRVRARVGRRQRRPLVLRRPGTTFLVVFAVVCLGALTVGLLAASQTIFAPAPPPSKHSAGFLGGTSPANSGLVGRPIDGTILALSVANSVVAIQPDSGPPIQAAVLPTSKITLAGKAAQLGSLIPGEAVVVVFAKGSSGQLVVAQLQDIVSVPTNTPSPTFVPTPTPRPTPTPPASPPAQPSVPIVSPPSP